MNPAVLVVTSIGLSMDAFAVSVCCGLSMKTSHWKSGLIVGLYFGIFQALMPLAGYLVSSLFAESIKVFDHWIAFILLVLIGIKMILESQEKDTCQSEKTLNPAEMLPMAVATSIDAMAVGVSFAFLKVDIFPAITLIGVITFCVSFVGVKIGRVFGSRYKSFAELAGGIILMLIGLKILFEHLEILAF